MVRIPLSYAPPLVFKFEPINLYYDNEFLVFEFKL
jgi:hypothetical protein